MGQSGLVGEEKCHLTRASLGGEKQNCPLIDSSKPLNWVKCLDLQLIAAVLMGGGGC